MKLANATEIHRKFGKPRDLLCALPQRNCARESPAHQACALVPPEHVVVTVESWFFQTGRTATPTEHTSNDAEPIVWSILSKLPCAVSAAKDWLIRG